jgi:Cellulase (glycosyl hydrolase family 5)
VRRMAGLPRSGGLPRWPSLVSVSALLLATAVSGADAGPAASAATAPSAACRHATGPFHVSGTKVRGAGGRVFVPYGITVPGLANRNWKASVSKDLTKIRATARFWCANTVRLQVAQDNLIGDTGHVFAPKYLAAIKREVALAERRHLVVVLNDQTETAPKSVTFQLGPTPGTETFWKDLIPVYGSDRQVIFDLFNEPRTFSTGMSQAQEWRLWHSGGTFNGFRYIGMAKLAADLRAAGAHNLFWAEGPDFAATLAGLERQHALLTSPDVVYAIHHPAGGHNTSAWFKDFGYLINTGVAPVVDGEWTNYRPFRKPNAECWRNAPRKVPVFLKYLADHGVGMTAYQLAAGLLVKSDSHLADPTTISARTWTCAVARGPTRQGAGALIMRWYRAHNS